MTGAPPKRRGTFLSGFLRLARLYSKSKIGVIGAAIIIFFVILAVFSPQIDSNPPVFGFHVGADFSVPAWATIFPQYQGYAVTGYVIHPAGFSSGTTTYNSWNLTEVSNGNAARSVSTLVPTTRKGKAEYPGSMQVNATIAPVDYNVSTRALPGGQAFFSLSQSFKWTSKSPNSFTIAVLFDPIKVVNVSQIYLNYIVSYPGGNHSLSTTTQYVVDTQVAYRVPNDIGTWHWSNMSDLILGTSGLPGLNTINIAKAVFPTTGEYTLTLQVQGVPTANATKSSISVDVASMSLYVQGNAFGILGTDNVGRDVWSQLVWGSQISLLVGILSGVGSVMLGALVGITAGYLGGITDEIIGRLTDFFLVLPFLPLLIIVVLIVGQNATLAGSIYVWVILIFVVLSWPSIARIIRSQVLSVKERQYVEASRAVGGGTGHILRRHILPNVMGLVYSQIALNVGGFILLEAALDYLAVAFRPISVITWGVMLTNALPFATVDSIHSYVWWWFLPPGISIAALSLAFVLVGFALDSIFNPRLRAR